MSQLNQDIHFLTLALGIAKKAVSWTLPNPLVGAVLVKNNTVIATGYHKKYGAAHGEIQALNQAKSQAKDATLYCTLEPCAHHGKTPPCTDAIIKAGIARVVYCTNDPNPRVNGRGAQVLRQAGIATSSGILEEKAVALNFGFFFFHTKKRPFCAVKFASTLDGKIATAHGDSRWITNEKARGYARSLRAEYQAVLVGKNTVCIDNPHLGVRKKGKRDPLRIILDSTLTIPLTSQVLRDKNCLIYTTNRMNKDTYRILQNRGISIHVCASSTISIPEILADCTTRAVTSILIEGGSKVIGSFFDAGYIDKVYAFHAPLLLGGENNLSAIAGAGAKSIATAKRLTNISVKRFGDNMLTTGTV